jgi:hypothetical protein
LAENRRPNAKIKTIIELQYLAVNVGR